MSSSTRCCAADRRRRLLRLALALAAAAGPAAAQPERGALPQASAAAGTSATAAHITRYVDDGRLLGEGRLTWFGFHVYDARLYAPANFDPVDATARPFVLELTYARRLSGRSIAEASRDEMRRLGFGDEAQHGRWLAQMQRLFPDVEPGRRIAGVNRPGGGARFYVDGSFAGSIDEPEFARAFFAIWLDPRSRAPRLRESLLKGARSSTAAAARAGVAPASVVSP